MKYFLLFVLICNLVKFNLATFTPIGKIIDILSAQKPEINECYTCQGNCENASVQKCQNGSNCFAMLHNDMEVKGCIDAAMADTLCKTARDCFTCTTNLCNNRQVGQAGVSQCYVCIDECSDPPEVHNCDEALNATEGKISPASCLSYEIQQGDTVTTLKGCISNNDVISKTCSLSNSVPGVKCAMCNTELCNNEIAAVSQCYWCENDCSNVQVQDCAKNETDCLTMETVRDGFVQTARKCVNADAVAGECQEINEKGGNCTVCEGDLCNGGEIAQGRVVQECYFLNGTSGEEVVQNCQLTFGEFAKTKCIVMEMDDLGRTIFKGCILDLKSHEEECKSIINQGRNCTICDSNLCNDSKKSTTSTTSTTTPKPDGDGNSAETYYYPFFLLHFSFLTIILQ